MPALLTAAAVLGLATQCQHSFPPEMILAIARNESQVAPDQFDPAAVHVNHDGSRDLGLMQINTKNLTWLGLTETAVMDPCISIAAAEAVMRMFSQYNSGSPIKSVAYARRAMQWLHTDAAGAVQPLPEPAKPHTADPFTRPAASQGGDVAYSTRRLP